MILTCPNCATRYQTDAAMVAPPGRNVRCAKCGQVWFQAPPEPAIEPEPVADAPSVTVPLGGEEEPAMADPTLGTGVAPDPGGLRPRRRATDDQPRSGFGRIAAWLVLLVIVAAVIFAILHYRQTIATLWPKTASMYAAIGMDVNTMGLALEDIQPSQSIDAGQPLLEVQGKIVNTTDHKIPVPAVRVALVDGESREVYHWTFDSGVGTLAPGSSGGFTTRLSSPPLEARTIVVRFAEAGEAR